METILDESVPLNGRKVCFVSSKSQKTWGGKVHTSLKSDVEVCEPTPDSGGVQNTFGPDCNSTYFHSSSDAVYFENIPIFTAGHWSRRRFKVLPLCVRSHLSRTRHVWVGHLIVLNVGNQTQSGWIKGFRRLMRNGVFLDSSIADTLFHRFNFERLAAKEHSVFLWILFLAGWAAV